MSRLVAARLETRPLSQALGAEIIGIDLRHKLPKEVYAAIIEQWHESLVILFRGQELSEDEQIRFAEQFGVGDLSEGHLAGFEQRPGLNLITNIRRDGNPVGILPDGEMQFHADQCYLEQPSIGAMLYAIQVPSRGGNTMFGNMYKAYDALAGDVKRRLAGLRARNVYDYNGNPTHRGDVSADAPTWVHPVVRTHPVTGRKCLFVNRLMSARIEGPPEAESAALLEMLFDHIERREFVYEHVWRAGDVLIWDNRCTVHARTDFDPHETRLMRRAKFRREAVY